VRLSLRRKLVGGFGLLLVLVAVLSWVTLSLFGSLRGVQRRVFDDAIPGLVTVDEIVRSYTAQSAAVRGYLNDPTQSSLLDEYRAEVDTAEFYQDQGVDLFTGTQEQDLLQDLIGAGHRFQSLVDDHVIPLAADGKRIQALAKLSTGTPLITRIQTLGQLLRQAQDRQVAQTESSVSAHGNQTVIILVVVIGGTLALGVLVAFLLPRRLGSNISALVDAARAIGRGDLDQEIDIRSGDEVEELAVRMTEMQAGLKRLQQLALQDRELEIAASIQRNLLQRTLPHTPNVNLVPLQRQANLVGGDWYDVDLAGRTLTVVVGDASGKGIAAALMATVALSALRAERGLGAGPKRVVQRANQALKDATDADSFTTLVYASVDIATGETRWLNMGHPSPFVLRAPTEGAQQARPGYFLEGPRNRALGWFDDPGLAETVVHLKPGDRLVLFTDGFLEAKSPQGEVFGEHRFGETVGRLALLETASIGEEVVREVERFAAGKLDDDLTMLVIEFLGVSQGEPAAEEAGEGQWRSRR
jgi:serine phosphatase RsbU (regulator of sigma subunit)/CHASE3 domain sensor protein